MLLAATALYLMAWFSDALGSPLGGLDAIRKARVAMYPTSGVFGMNFPLVSMDMKDMSRFWIKFSRSASGTFANRDVTLEGLFL
jgi:hypothetical protein